MGFVSNVLFIESGKKGLIDATKFFVPCKKSVLFSKVIPFKLEIRGSIFHTTIAWLFFFVMTMFKHAQVCYQVHVEHSLQNSALGSVCGHVGYTRF